MKLSVSDVWLIIQSQRIIAMGNMCRLTDDNITVEIDCIFYLFTNVWVDI